MKKFVKRNNQKNNEDMGNKIYESKCIKFTLPWPPSDNNKNGVGFKKANLPLRRSRVYGRKNIGIHKNINVPIIYLKDHVKKYYEDCANIIKHQLGNFNAIKDYVRVNIIFREPDNRIHDEGNTYKCLFDALEHSGILENDKFIRGGTRDFGTPIKNGCVEITLVPTKKYNYNPKYSQIKKDFIEYPRYTPNRKQKYDDFGEINFNSKES